MSAFGLTVSLTAKASAKRSVYCEFAALRRGEAAWAELCAPDLAELMTDGGSGTRRRETLKLTAAKI